MHSDLDGCLYKLAYLDLLPGSLDKDFLVFRIRSFKVLLTCERTFKSGTGERELEIYTVPSIIACQTHVRPLWSRDRSSRNGYLVRNNLKYMVLSNDLFSFECSAWWMPNKVFLFFIFYVKNFCDANIELGLLNMKFLGQLWLLILIFVSLCCIYWCKKFVKFSLLIHL